MYLVHLLWLGLGRYPATDALFLWVEDARQCRAPRGVLGIPKHPRALTWAKLDSQVLTPWQLPHPGTPARHREKLLLPTALGAPLTSYRWLRHTASADASPVSAELQPWEVTGYRLHVDYIAQVARCGLPRWDSAFEPGAGAQEGAAAALAHAQASETPALCALAPDAVSLIGAAALALRLIDSGTFRPEFHVTTSMGEHYLQAAWLPVLSPGSGDVAQAELRAPRVLQQTSASPRPVTEVVHVYLDAAVRSRLARARLKVDRSLEFSEALPAIQLLSGTPGAKHRMWHERLADKGRELATWSEGLGTGPDPGVRLGFRLEPLVDGQAATTADQLAKALTVGPASPSPGRPGAKAEVAGPPETWYLSFLVHPESDPSLLVPVDAFASNPGCLGQDFSQPSRAVEGVLAGLRSAALACRPVTTALVTGRLHGVELGLAEAMEFMAESAGRLREMGFSTLVPAVARLTARLAFRTKAHPQATSGSATQDSSGQPTPAGKSWFNEEGVTAYNWQIAMGGEAISREELHRIAELKAGVVRFRGQWVAVEETEVQRAIDLLASVRSKQSPAVALRMALTADTIAEADIGLPLEPPSMDMWLRETLGKLREFRGAEDAPAPAGLHGQLRHYQRAAVSWLAFMRSMGLGACLADDMGLGKTVEFIAHLLAARAAGQLTGPSLLVCPTSVVGNWERELARFAPDLKVMVHHGQSRISGSEFAAVSAGFELVICPYSLLSRDDEELLSVHWDTIALDEAQNIKNASSKQAQAARALHAGHRIALTGTPIENRLRELWSIFSFLNPGLLGSAQEFRERYEQPIERGGDEDAAEKLRALAGPFILRRVKTDPRVIGDLPAKQEFRVFCNLTKEQATLYQAVLSDMLQKVATAGAMERRGLVLATLTVLKQVCNHPSHFLKDGGELAHRSGKLERLVELLEEVIGAGDRALVFTQYAEMGHLLQKHIGEGFGLQVPFLYGGVGRAVRDTMVTRFQAQKGCPLLLVSLKAGGTGLNLTAANHVFHYDRWWNPAVEDQATDRVYRIGQSKGVMVHKLVCAGTLEERIDLMIEDKRALAGHIVSSAEALITELPTQKLAELLSLRLSDVGEY